MAPQLAQEDTALPAGRTAGAGAALSVAASQLIDRLRRLSRVRVSADARWLTAILVLALALRLAWVVAVQPDPRDGRFDDSVWYYLTAQHLTEGDGYVFPTDVWCPDSSPPVDCDQLPPTALWAPGYPLLLAGVFHLPGDDVANARALNVVAGLAAVLGVYYLGRRLWNSTAGLFAAAAMAAFPSQIFFSSLLLTETVFTAAAVGLLCLAAAWTLDRERAPYWKLIALGIAAGLLAMIRPEGAVFLGVIALTWLLVHRSLRRAGLYLGLAIVGAAVLFVPWTVRNAIQLDAFVPGTTGAGQVLRQAHHPSAQGYPDLFIANQLWLEFDHVPLPEREIRINNRGIRDSVDYALGNLDRERELIGHRLAAFYRGDRAAIAWNQVADSNHRRSLSEDTAEFWGVASDSYYYAVIGIGVFGLMFWVWRSRGRHWLLWGTLLAYTTMWACLFTGEPRYHLPLVPIFALLAGIGLAAAAWRIQQARDIVRALPRPGAAAEGSF